MILKDNMDKDNYIEYWREQTKSHKTKNIEINGIKLKIPFGVFNPSKAITYSSSFLLESLPKNLSNKSILDMGTGSGVIAIQSEKNNAQDIIAVDIDKKSSQIAFQNSQLNNCSRITCIFSDLFNQIAGGSFDYIFANLPILEIDFDDLYFRLLNQYENYLSGKGELWVVFASFGDMDNAKKYFENHPKFIEKLEISKFNVDWFIYKLKK